MNGMVRRLHRFLQGCADLAGIALLLLMAMTVVDIVGRHLHLIALRGTVELSTGVTVLIGFLAFPFSFLQGGHLVLDTFTAGLPRRMTRAIDTLWYGVAVIAFATMAVLTWQAAMEAYADNDLSMDLQIPMLWLWIPAAVGTTLSPFGCIVAAFRRAREQS